jgi:hypothetical protein
MTCFWPDDEPRIHAMIVNVSRNFDKGSHTELRLSINHRSEVHGEIVLRVPDPAPGAYRIGAVYAAHFKHAPLVSKPEDCFWPEGEPRIHMVVTSISKPFDFGRVVEIQFKVNNRPEIQGEIALRVPASHAGRYHVGAEYAAHFKHVSYSV